MCVEFSGGRNSLENVPTYAKEINSGIFGNLTLGRKNEGLKSRDLNLQEGPGHANRAGCMTAPAFDRPQSACALLHGARLQRSGKECMAVVASQKRVHVPAGTW